MNINIIGPINTLGYGYAAYNIACSLMTGGHRVSLFPIGDKIENSLASPMLQQMLDNAKFFDKNAPCIRIWHQDNMSHFVGRGEHIGFPIFELDKFKEQELHHLKSCDRLFVCSEWAKEICRANGIEIPINVVNLGVNREVFKPAPIKSGPTIFVNCGKWEVRKGHDILAETFMKTFTSMNDVLLIMCPTNPFLTPQEEAAWKKKYNHPKIKIISRLPSHSDVAKMFNNADCGVFPSRAEGWNLEALEVLSCGRQLIITDYSAHKEFCNNSNSKLIKIDNTEPAQDNKWFFGQGNWAKLESRQIEQLCDYMYEVHAMKQSGKLGLNKEGIATAEKYTWEHATQQILESLNGNNGNT